MSATKKHIPYQMKLSKAEIERRLTASSPDNCINWRGAPLRTGDNFLFRAGHHLYSLVGQMIDLNDQGSVPKAKKQFIGTKGKLLSSWMALD
jgi:hypothetical protein